MRTLRIFGYFGVVLAGLTLAGATLAHEDSRNSMRPFFPEPTVSIGSKGEALVRGAKITAIASGSLTAETSWKGVTLAWTVDTDGDTSYLSASGGSVARADLAVGDAISFSGTLEGALSVEADVVRSWSLNKEHAALTGTVRSVGSGSFVLETEGRRVTVDVDSSTRFSLERGGSSLDDVAVGSTVRVKGSWNDDEFDASSVTAVTHKTHGNKWNEAFKWLKDVRFGWK